MRRTANDGGRRQSGPSHAFGETPAGIMEAPRVVLPAADLFGERAARFRELMKRVEALDAFLDFMGRLAQAQQQVLSGREPAWRPSPDAFDVALARGAPPLAFVALRRDVDWQADLAALLEALELHIGANQRPLLEALRRSTPEQLEAMADDLFEGRPGEPAQRGLLPLVAAALQVAWVRLAAALPRAPELQRSASDDRERVEHCPCCGGAPAVGVIHGEQRRSGVRYLVCGLCATEWHLERVTCSVCHRGGQLIYLSLDRPTAAGSAEKEAGEAEPRRDPRRRDSDDALLPVDAECCNGCGHYLKLVQRGREGHAEPLADDLASLALDLMLAEPQGDSRSYSRHGYNPLLVVGDE